MVVIEEPVVTTPPVVVVAPPVVVIATPVVVAPPVYVAPAPEPVTGYLDGVRYTQNEHGSWDPDPEPTGGHTRLHNNLFQQYRD